MHLNNTLHCALVANTAFILPYNSYVGLKAITEEVFGVLLLSAGYKLITQPVKLEPRQDMLKV